MTDGYGSPEQAKFYKYNQPEDYYRSIKISTKSDVYSLGRSFESIGLSLSWNGIEPEAGSEAAKNLQLIKKITDLMTIKDPLARPSAKEILEKFF